ncbi:MAG: hypothetical protein ACPLUL_01830 [Thermanaerothrix sp.]|uniref:hypothetical protein n=1 Tax=Thermanaerothrix sp. TaxID=2972675 RepID=UPI003C7CD782
MRGLGWIITILIGIGLLVVWGLGTFPLVQAQTAQSNTLSLVSPLACPAAGCAAGQRLNVRAAFSVGVYDPNQSPNVQVCVYTPVNWSVSEVTFSPQGIISGATYAVGDISACEPAPSGYELKNGASATLGVDQFGDALDFAFRIGANAGSSGTLRVRVLEKTNSGWVRIQDLFLYLWIIPKATNVYVANDATACGQFNPCYVNSYDDLTNGVGTGLKDAVDAVDPGSVVNVVGEYSIKSQTVVVDKPLILQGVNNAALTYVGSICDQPMLYLKGGVTLRDLTIRDGACSSPSRDLVIIEPTGDVRVEYVTLINGKDALHVLSGGGQVLVQFSHIQGNQGYAILGEPDPSSGRIVAVGNNLYGNRAGAQVECNNRGKVNHNFLGWGGSLTSAVSQCEFDPIKALGAPILRRNEQAGVSGARVTVTETKTYAFEGRIAFQRVGGTDFDLYIIEHGAGSTLNVPFTGGSSDDLIPCSSYWDLFLAEGSSPSSTLNLFFRYDLSPGCASSVESSLYCGSGNPALYPLWWYHPAGNITQGWDTTGQRPMGSAAAGSNGQTTVCLTNEKQIRVDIDNDGRPNLLSDLSYLPFVVGLPARPETLTPSLTASFTPSITFTASITPTRTVTRTITPIPTWTRSPTRPLLPTRTRTPTPTRTPFATRTPSRTPFGGVTVTLTSQVTFSVTPTPPGFSGQTLTPAGYPLSSPTGTGSTSEPAYPGAKTPVQTTMTPGKGYPSGGMTTPPSLQTAEASAESPVITPSATANTKPLQPDHQGVIWAVVLGGSFLVGAVLWGYWYYHRYLKKKSLTWVEDTKSSTEAETPSSDEPGDHSPSS